MTVSNITPVSISASKGARGAVDEINVKLLANLSWLTNAYGVSELLRETGDQKARVFTGRYPAVHATGIEYINMLPDAHLGNYSFWEVTENGSGRYRVKYDFRLIIYFDQTTISAATYSTIDDVKHEIRSLFRTIGVKKSGVRVEDIEDGFSNVYRGYDLDKVDGNQLKYPYSAIAIKGNMYIKANEIAC